MLYISKLFDNYVYYNKDDYKVVSYLGCYGFVKKHFNKLITLNKEKLNNYKLDNNVYDIPRFINEVIKFTDLLLLTEDEKQEYKQHRLLNFVGKENTEYNEKYSDVVCTSNEIVNCDYNIILKNDSDIELLGFVDAETRNYHDTLNMYTYIKRFFYKNSDYDFINIIVNLLEVPRFDYFMYKKKDNLLKLAERISNLNKDSFMYKQLHKDNSIKVFKIIINIALEQLNEISKNKFNNAVELKGFHIIAQNYILKKWIEEYGKETNIRRKVDTLVSFNFFKLVDKNINKRVSERIVHIKNMTDKSNYILDDSTIIFFNDADNIPYEITKDKFKQIKEEIKKKRIEERKKKREKIVIYVGEDAEFIEPWESDYVEFNDYDKFLEYYEQFDSDIDYSDTYEDPFEEPLY